MSTIYMPAWELFDRTFKEGDAVIVVTDQDEWAWGTLSDVSEDGALLKQRTKHHHIYWADMRFMCHDGFPVQKLKGADGSASIIALPNQRIQIRNLLTRRLGLTELVFSDPFYIEGIAQATLYNEGNEAPNFFYTDNEEVLELVAPDGATAHLWSLNTVWHCN